MFFFTGVFIAVLVVIAFKAIRKILSNIEKEILADIKENKLKLGYISRKDLASLETEAKVKNRLLYNLAARNPVLVGLLPYRLIFKDMADDDFRGFMFWCDRYLESMGYANRRYISTGIRVKDNDISNLGQVGAVDVREALYSYTCKEGSDIIYVQCVLMKQNPETCPMDEDKWPELGREAVQRFVGVMQGDGVKRGVFITTGDFSTQAKEYAATLPSPYTLQLLDGIEITKKHRRVVSMELRKLAKGEAG